MADTEVLERRQASGHPRVRPAGRTVTGEENAGRSPIASDILIHNGVPTRAGDVPIRRGTDHIRPDRSGETGGMAFAPIADREEMGA